MIKLVESEISKKPLDKLTEEEINSLPERFTCCTRIPGGNYGYKLEIVEKEDFLSNPKKCFFIDSYWGYAYPRDIYIATKEYVSKQEHEEIAKVSKNMEYYRNNCIE